MERENFNQKKKKSGDTYDFLRMKEISESHRNQIDFLERLNLLELLP